MGREGWTAVVGLAVSLASSGHPLSQQCPSFLQRVLLPCHPQGPWLVPAALHNLQLCPEGKVAAGPVTLAPTLHCWVPQSLQHPRVAVHLSGEHPWPICPVCSASLCLCGTGLAGGPEQHQAPQLAAMGAGGRLALALLGDGSRACPRLSPCTPVPSAPSTTCYRL